MSVIWYMKPFVRQRGELDLRPLLHFYPLTKLTLYFEIWALCYTVSIQSLQYGKLSRNSLNEVS